MKITQPLLAAAIVVAALPASAQWYVGATAGGSKASLDTRGRTDQLLDLGFDDASSRGDESDTAYRVHLGWRFHPNFAAEAGYGDLGRFKLRSDVLPLGSLRSTMRATAADLSLLGLLPLGERWTVFGKVGAFEARTRSSFSGSGSVSLFEGSGDRSNRKSGVVYGVGLMADVMPRLAVRAEYDYYRRLGDDLTGKFDVKTLMVGVQYRF